MYKNYTLLLITTFLLSTTLNAQNNRKVLFLGNSYTQYNNLPNLVSQIATSMGDTLVSSSITPGGQTLQGHSTDVNAQNAIKQNSWDVVVLQEQSQKPAFSPGQVAGDVYPYAKALCDSIRANNSCTQPMFYMTWGRKNGDAANCAAYPPICTYGGMQQRLRESYLQMAQDNSALTSPVGAVWKMVRDSVPSINLYDADESHPSFAGSYLAACVFYASIFHRNPHGSTFTGGLSASDAERLQYFAGKIVMDSMNHWQQHANYAYADFSYTIGSNFVDVTFQNNSMKATGYQWAFGDGNTSMSTSPMHTYASQGIYAVTLTASNTCNSERKRDTVNNSSVSIIDNKLNNKLEVAYNTGSVIFTDRSNYYHTLSLVNTSGITVKKYDLINNRTVIVSDLMPGLYIYIAEGDKNRDIGKIQVH